MRPRSTQQVSRTDIVELILSTLRDVVSRKGQQPRQPLGVTTPLIGSQAPLDSLGLVTLVVEVEQRLEEHTDLPITLADERAVSQKQSPFRTVASLADYACALIQDRAHDGGT